MAFLSVGHKLRVCVCVWHTCAWSYQPAVQKASSQGVVEDQGPLAVDRFQNVLHRDWDVGVGAASRLLARFLPLNKKVGKGSRAAPLGDGQRLVVPAWEGVCNDKKNKIGSGKKSESQGSKADICGTPTGGRV